MTKNVTLRQHTHNGEVKYLHVLVDGEYLGYGTFGGEPEDNSAERKYSWVEPLLVRLAQALGSENISRETFGVEEEYYD